MFGPNNPAIVLDNGTGLLKAGYAGEVTPRAVVPMILGRPKQVKLRTSIRNGGFFARSGAGRKRGALALSYPIVNGVVHNWDDLETIWNHVFTNELRVLPEDHPILLTEAPLNPRTNREKLAELTFERFRAPAMYVSMPAVLALYASGRTTGLVLECGEGVTHWVPVFDAYIIHNAIIRHNLAGRDVTNYLRKLLVERGNNFTTAYEHEVVRDAKEKICYVALEFQRELQLFAGKGSHGMNYRLPDGQKLQVGSERFCAPELLFNPNLDGYELSGIHQTTYESITKCDVDLRKSFFESIILTGGGTMFEGFPERMKKELSAMAPKTVKVNILSTPERKYSVWIGGAVLASLSSFNEMWVTRREYEESGPSIVSHRCF
ncbi:unnamed protein product [Dicrocoelium dendriticum]|nr:unnamed protein product [Dicrocoelium dendriticum]